MPLPVTPLGRNEGYDTVFNVPTSPETEVYLANKRFVNESVSEHSAKLLETIDKHQDSVCNAAVEAVSGRTGGEKFYTVPASISDQELLKLKTEGYCLGAGRSVRLSDKAKNVLKKKYLSSENRFKSNRVKKKVINEQP